MHIRVIDPVTTSEWEEGSRQVFQAAAAEGTEISVVSLAWGPPSIEVRADSAWAAPGILQRVLEAARAGVDAIIINCMDDPGLYAAREMVRIPVVGPAEASMHLAAILAHRFSIVTTDSRDIPSVEELVGRYRMREKLASIRALDIPVLELRDDPEATFRALIESAEQAVLRDGAGAIIPGCTLLAQMAQRAQAELAERGCEVPVLNPSAVALKSAEAQVALGYTHSARTFAAPGDKKIIWPIEQDFV